MVQRMRREWRSVQLLFQLGDPSLCGG